MNFLKRLFGIKPDPTKSWPVLPVSTPPIDLRTTTFGPLRFGTAFDEVKVLGRPDEYKHYNFNTCDLLYARAGYEVEIEEGRFVGIRYFIGRDAYTDAHKALVRSRPTAILPDGTTRELNADTKGEALVEIFGAPKSADMDEDDSLLVWDHGEVTIEAELNESTQLVSLNLYLTH